MKGWGEALSDEAVIIREALTVLHRRLQKEGYGPEFGQPDPEDLFNEALVVLDWMEAEIARLQEEAKARVASWNDLRAHADRCEAALRMVNRAECSERIVRIARRALGEEAPLPRSFLDDPKIQAQIAEAKERARKGGEKA